MQVAQLCLNRVNAVTTARTLLNDTLFKRCWVRTVHAEVYKYQYSCNLKLYALCYAHWWCIVLRRWFAYLPEVKKTNKQYNHKLFR